VNPIKNSYLKYVVEDKSRLSYFIYALILFLSYRYNLFGITPNDFFNQFQNDSEQFVINRIVSSFENGLLSNAGLLLMGENDQFTPYLGQLGLQGLIFGLINNLSLGILPISFFHSLVSFITVLTLVGIMICFDKFTKLKTSSVLFLVLLFASPFLSSMARNLYWVPGTMFLPLFIMFLIVSDIIRHNKLISKKHLAILFFVFTLRFSMGFEFTSTILVAASVPLLFTLNDQSNDFVLFFKRFIQYSIVALSSFVLVLFVHIIQKSFYFGNVITAVQQQLYNVATRSNFIAGIEVESVYLDSLNTNYLVVILRYLMSPVLLLVLLLTFVTILHLARMIRKQAVADKFNYKIVSAWLAFVAPISWFILASGHSAIHTHINYMLWSLPFSLFATATIYDYSLNLKLSAYKWYKISIYLILIFSISISVLFNSIVYSDNRNIRLFAANFYHETWVFVSDTITLNITVQEIYQSNGKVSISFISSLRAESLLSLNNGKVSIGDHDLQCDWTVDGDYINLLCATNDRILQNDDVLQIIYRRD
jgi:hypothetical protein